MSSPFIAEIVMFAGNFAPRNWAYCDGQLLDIASYTAVFSLMGTTYGGDGRVTFGLPDLRGRMPLGPRQGPGLSNRVLGQRGGAQSVTLATSQIPPHDHAMRGTTVDGDNTDPTGRFPASPKVEGRPVQTYNTSANVDMGDTNSAGSGGAHENMPPFLAINFIVALQGVFPSRN